MSVITEQANLGPDTEWKEAIVPFSPSASPGKLSEGAFEGTQYRRRTEAPRLCLRGYLVTN
jgi:hypothetical protein